MSASRRVTGPKACSAAGPSRPAASSRAASRSSGVNRHGRLDGGEVEAVERGGVGAEDGPLHLGGERRVAEPLLGLLA